MDKLSVAIATYNEEDSIGRCLKSLQEWIDEIVIVDGASQDKTVEVAKQFGAKVTVSDNPPMFHINKQKAIDRATGDWILQLDADEVVSDELQKEILDVVKDTSKNYPAVNGYWIPRKNFFLGRFLTKGGQYPDYTLRLYKKGKGKLPCKSVHEQAVVEGETKYLNKPLLHFPYPDFSHYLEHFNRYTTIAAKELKDKSLAINAWSFLMYMLVKPKMWFLLTYFRHKGFQDGMAGFVFSLFSSLRFPVTYIKYWEMNKK